ncbi:MAG TPA: glycosyltransferase family 4 protein [Gemmatimonadales bacterium]|nr:glycosyltransferase family 4 protein [Gemmatimonadales bacterium]
MWKTLIVVLAVAAALSVGLIAAVRPAFARYAMARPNARSSHAVPTPQGGGIAVVAATLIGAWLGAMLTNTGLSTIEWLTLSTATILLALTGAIDDIRGLGPAPRLLIQIVAVGLVIASLPDDFSVVPQLARPFERALLLLGGVWFVNLVNFMDGIDWMTVAEVVPVTAGVALLGFIDGVPPGTAVIAVALLGAIIGFAPFNRPVARLFLGDVGSLPIGLLLGWLMLMLAGRNNLAAAILLPLYYLADATITLARRLVRREAVWEAHRTHFYQRATDGGFSVEEIVVRVFVINLALAGLALITAIEPDPRVDVATIALGGALVAWLLLTFQRGKR